MNIYVNTSPFSAESLSIRTTTAGMHAESLCTGSPTAQNISFSSDVTSVRLFSEADRHIKFRGVESCVAVLLGISSASSVCRRRTWLALFGVSDCVSSQHASLVDGASAVADDEQVWLDVNRCQFCHDTHESPSVAELSSSAAASLALRRQKLHTVIMSVLRSDKSFKYTQGFHDFCAVALHVIDGEQSTNCTGEVARDFICAVGRRHLRASLCDPNLEAAVAACSRVFCVLLVIDQPLALHIQALDVDPIVCLSWILTLFTHPLSGYKPQAIEVLDFIFASDDDYTVLLCACVIADSSSFLLQIRDGGEAFKAILQCPMTSLLPVHRRRMCLCRALQMSLSKHTKCGGRAAGVANIAAVAPSSNSAGFSSTHASLSSVRPREIRP
jgi:hypothetical protein